jgi:hypothetical protein
MLLVEKTTQTCFHFEEVFDIRLARVGHAENKVSRFGERNSKSGACFAFDTI